MVCAGERPFKRSNRRQVKMGSHTGQVPHSGPLVFSDLGFRVGFEERILIRKED